MFRLAKVLLFAHYAGCIAMSFYNESLSDLEARLRTILPELYQDSYEEVKPVSMGSAALRYDKSGAVAWGEMWESFCDLAMAGGPPHKGSLLSPGTAEEIEADPNRYQEILQEIRRGIDLVADLKTEMTNFPGWLRVECDDAVMAEWLVRAITMENVSCHWEADAVYLPVGPGYRVEKEIKNVVTVIAKTCHYWVDHMWFSQQRTIADLFAAMAIETPLLVPPFPKHDPHADKDLVPQIEEDLYKELGLVAITRENSWLGFECQSVNAAIWIMRGMVASNVLARREGTILFVALNEKSDPGRKRMLQTLAHVCKLAKVAQVVSSENSTRSNQ